MQHVRRHIVVRCPRKHEEPARSIKAAGLSVIYARGLLLFVLDHHGDHSLSGAIHASGQVCGFCGDERAMAWPLGHDAYRQTPADDVFRVLWSYRTTSAADTIWREIQATVASIVQPLLTEVNELIRSVQDHIFQTFLMWMNLNCLENVYCYRANAYY